MPAIPFPVSTERVRIRPAIVEDMPSWAALYRDPAQRTFLQGPIDRTPEEWWKRQCGLDEVKALTIETLDGHFVGVGGYLFSTMPTDKMEVWLMIAKEFEGDGLGTDVVAALVSVAFQSYGVHTVTAIVDPENKRSIRLMSKLGFKLSGTHKQTHPRDWQGGHPVYSVTRAEFTQQTGA